MNKILILIIIMIFAVPISSVVPSFGGLWYSQYLTLLFCLFIGISIFLWNFNKYLSIFNAISVISVFFTAKINPRAVVLLFNFSIGCLGAYLISKFNQKQRRWIIRSIFILFIIQFCWLILQAYNIPITVDINGIQSDITFKSLQNPGRKELVAFSASPDQIGTFFALTLPIALYVYPLFGLLSLAGLFISKSAFAAISGISGGLIYLIFAYPKKIIIFMIITFIILLGYFKYADKVSQADFKTRGGVWRHAVNSTLKGELKIEKFGVTMAIHANSLFGYGFGQFLNYFPYVPQKDRHFNYVDEKFTHAHNEYIETFFEMGKIGLISLILLLALFLKEFICAKKSKELVMLFSCIVAYLLNSAGNFLSQIAVSGMLLILFYGMFKGVIRENGQITAMG